MIQLYDAIISKCIVHFVGNRGIDEGVKYSNDILDINEVAKDTLCNYFYKPFVGKEDYYTFWHQTEIELNTMYSYISSIFQNKECMHSVSVNIARYLYEQSTHPKIKGGELYIAYIEKCILDGKVMEAIGIFKSESKDTFITIKKNEEGFEIESQRGVNVNKLDKGCLIFNTEKENGYLLAIVDNANKGVEAKYWTDDFLHVRLRKDSYNQTQNMLSLCKNFVAQLPTNNGKVEKATYINRSIDALKDEIVNINSFAEKVFEKPELVSDFRRYKETYQQEQNIDIDDSFETTPKAINHRCVGTMTTIKLDKNFDINIHGGEQYIVRGYDEARDLHYYQLFFKEEK